MHTQLTVYIQQYGFLNPQSKKGNNHLTLHKREPQKSHYTIFNTQYQ